MAIDGTWSADMETPMGKQTISLQLASAGTTLTGKMSGSGGSVELFDGHVDGNKASWRADITQPMPLRLEFSVTVGRGRNVGQRQARHVRRRAAHGEARLTLAGGVECAGRDVLDRL